MQIAAYETVQPKSKVWNGHNSGKGGGDSTYRGKLENLPRPEHFNLDEAIEMMYSDGYCIIPEVLNRWEVAALRKKMDCMGGDDQQYHVPNWCYNKHIGLDMRKDADFLEYIDRPNLFEVADAVHGGVASIAGTLWITGKGREMGIHLDHLTVPMPEDVLMDPRVRVPIFRSTAHYYLNDMVAELGPTIVIPGSHKAGRPPENESTWRGITPKAAMVRAGDVCLFRAELWHGAWRNTSEERRYMMQVFYNHAPFGNKFPASMYSAEVTKAATS